MSNTDSSRGDEKHIGDEAAQKEVIIYISAVLFSLYLQLLPIILLSRSKKRMQRTRKNVKYSSKSWRLSLLPS